MSIALSGMLPHSSSAGMLLALRWLTRAGRRTDQTLRAEYKSLVEPGKLNKQENLGIRAKTVSGVNIVGEKLLTTRLNL